MYLLTNLFAVLTPIFTLIALILAILMPFFVLRIRNEMIENNRKMERLIEAVGGERKRGFFEPKEIENPIYCPDCHTKNKNTETHCVNCSMPL